MSRGPVPELLSCHRGTPGLEQHHRRKQPEPAAHWDHPTMAGPCLALLLQNGLGDHDCPCSDSSPWQGGHHGRAEPSSPAALPGVTTVGKLGTERAALLPHRTKGVPGRHLAVVFLKTFLYHLAVSLILTLVFRWIFSSMSLPWDYVSYQSTDRGHLAAFLLAAWQDQP